MMRTQVFLTPEQHANVSQKAAGLGVTMAEYIRRLVDNDLAEVAPGADPSSIFAIGSSGGSNIAAEKNLAVADAISARWATRTQ